MTFRQLSLDQAGFRFEIGDVVVINHGNVPFVIHASRVPFNNAGYWLRAMDDDQMVGQVVYADDQDLAPYNERDP